MSPKKIGAPTTGTPKTETCEQSYRDTCTCQAAAIPTLPADQIGYVQALKLKTGHSDHTLEQVWRDETHAVYKHFGSYGQFIGWESILIKVAPAQRIFGKDYPHREVYPSNEDFGHYALSVGAQYDLEYAIEKAKTLKGVTQRQGASQEISPEGPATPTWIRRRRTGTGTN